MTTTYIPSLEDLEDALQVTSDLIKESLLFGYGNTDSVYTLSNAVRDEGDWPGGGALMAATAESYRFSFANFVKAGAKSLYDPIMLGYARRKGIVSNTFTRAIWDSVMEYMIENDIYVDTRGITFDSSGTITTLGGGAGTGNGVVYRAQTDKRGQTIEGVWLGDVRIICNTTKTGSEIGSETFRMEMDQALDIFSPEISGEGAGSREQGTLSNHNGDDNNLQAASFEIGTAADADPSTLGNWLSTITINGTNYEIVEDGHHYSATERTLGKALCLKIKAAGSIYQDIKSVSYDVPYFWGFYAKKTASQTGTIKAEVGTNDSASVDISTLSTSTWTAVVPSDDKYLWMENSLADSGTTPPRFKITTASLGGGTGVLADGAWFRRMTLYNGTYWQMTQGTTPWKKNDVITFTDVLAGSDSEIQRQFFFAYGEGYYLPSRAAGTHSTGAISLTYNANQPGSRDSIERGSGSFITDGFVAGRVATPSGTSNNDQGYLIDEVAALHLYVRQGLTLNNITAEGPVSSTVTMSKNIDNP